MADRSHHDDGPETWAIGRRAGRVAGMAAIAIPLGLLAAVVGAGWFYERRVAPETHRPVTTFPAPGVETFIHDGVGDPHRPTPARRIDPSTAAAKRAVAADGLAGWPRP